MRVVWSYGFRPFFLAGALLSLWLVAFWAIVYYRESLPAGYFDPINWHAHEMIYGFVISIVSGFLLTAGANWTQTRPVSGTKLMVLFFLWLAGRVAFGLSILDLAVPHWTYFLVDMLFIPGLVTALAPAFIGAKQIRNIQFLFVLSFLAIGNLLTHLAALEVIDYAFATKGIYLGVNLILLIIVIIGGRVVPAFSNNTIAGIGIKKYDLLEKAVVGSLWTFILLDFTQLWPAVTGWVALVAAVLNFVRLATWKSWKTSENSLIWVLHLGYLWIPSGFVLIFLSDIAGILPRSVAIHAFTAGAMGTFIIGMISRVSLGHTGRPLHTPKGFVFSYLLVTLSGVVRVASGFFEDFYRQGILIAGLLWAGSFLMFVIYYARILLAPRPDGRPG